jgi:hypothetical protein
LPGYGAPEIEAPPGHETGLERRIQIPSMMIKTPRDIIRPRIERGNAVKRLAGRTSSLELAMPES